MPDQNQQKTSKQDILLLVKENLGILSNDKDLELNNHISSVIDVIQTQFPFSFNLDDDSNLIALMVAENYADVREYSPLLNTMIENKKVKEYDAKNVI